MDAIKFDIDMEAGCEVCMLHMHNLNSAKLCHVNVSGPFKKSSFQLLRTE